MTVTPADARAAEQFALEQRLTGAKLLRLDESKAPTPDALNSARKVKALAEADPLKFDGMLGDKAVGALFACGALHFGGRA